MTKTVLFVQGAGEGAYAADQLLADSLQASLGDDYEVIYPPVENEDDPDYDVWKAQITGILDRLDSDSEVILAGHSFGGSLLLKALGDARLKETLHPRTKGVFLVATPYWGADDFWKAEEYELPDDIAARIPASVPIYLYHCRDDEMVPFSHLAMIAQHLPQAFIRIWESGGHQCDNDLSRVAADITRL